MKHKVIFLIGCLVCAAFAAFMTVQMQRYLNRPTLQDWRQVQVFVKKQQVPGDALIFFPAWLYGYATDVHGFAGLNGIGPDRLYARTVTFDRVWVIDCFHVFDDKKLLATGLQRVQENTINGVRVRLYQRRAPAVSWRLTTPPNSAEHTDSMPERKWDRFRSLSRAGVAAPSRKGQNMTFTFGVLPPGNLVLCGGITDGGLMAMDFEPIKARVERGGGNPATVNWKAKSGWYCHSIRRGDENAPVSVTWSSKAKKERVFLFDLLVVRNKDHV